MVPINTPQCNIIMTGADSDPDVAEMPAKLNKREAAFETYWMPGIEERTAIAHGANVKLTVKGTTHPPVRLDVSYIGPEGPVHFANEVMDKLKLAEISDEAIAFARKAEELKNEMYRQLERCRKHSDCPDGVDLVDHIVQLKNDAERSKNLLERIRHKTECPGGKSLLMHIEAMIETMEALVEDSDDDEMELDDDDFEDEGELDDEDWWKSQPSEEEE